MLRRLAGSIAANPVAYDLIQRLVGAHMVNARVSRAIEMRTRGLLLDVGGGTGLDTALQPAGIRYIAVDLDRSKLRRLRKKQPAAAAVLGDGTALPVKDGSADLVLIKSVLHHLDEAEIGAVLEEVARVLAPGGCVLVSDALWDARRWPGRALWAADRGSHPRAESDLRRALETRFQVTRWETYAILHRYVLAVAVPASHGLVEAGGRPRAR